jgi:hypothetical protein
MTETTQPDPRVARVYPDGWNLGYCVSGSESDGTACVPIAVDRDAVAEDAETAERATGARMEVFHDGEHWCYRPALTPARKPLTVADIPAGQGPASLFLRDDPVTVPTDTRPGLNAAHLSFLARLIDVADQTGVAVVYCCLNNGWSVMTRPELDDEAGGAFLAALDVGEVGEPDQQASRTILAGPEFSSRAVRLYVRPLPTDVTTEDAP